MISLTSSWEKEQQLLNTLKDGIAERRRLEE
jgi:hypothetical protein